MTLYLFVPKAGTQFSFGKFRGTRLFPTRICILRNLNQSSRVTRPRKKTKNKKSHQHCLHRQPSNSHGSVKPNTLTPLRIHTIRTGRVRLLQEENGSFRLKVGARGSFCCTTLVRRGLEDPEDQHPHPETPTDQALTITLREKTWSKFQVKNCLTACPPTQPMTTFQKTWAPSRSST